MTQQCISSRAACNAHSHIERLLCVPACRVAVRSATPLYSAHSLAWLSPPPWAAALPTGWWVHFQHSLSTSSQWQWLCLFVLFLFLVCFHLPKCVFFCAPSVSYINNSVSCVLFALLSGLPLISSAVFLCACSYPRCLLYPGIASALFWLAGLTQVPCRGGGSQQGSSPACWRNYWRGSGRDLRNF